MKTKRYKCPISGRMRTQKQIEQAGKRAAERLLKAFSRPGKPTAAEREHFLNSVDKMERNIRSRANKLDDGELKAAARKIWNVKPQDDFL